MPDPGELQGLSPEERSAVWTSSPRIGLGEAAARHRLLTALPVVICMAAALAAGLVRSPTYTAKTRMQVASMSLGAPGALSGLSTASQSLASTYALSVDADAVLGPAAQRLGLATAVVRRQVSGTPVAQSAVFTISATGKQPERTRLVANTVSESLAKFVASQATRQSTDELLAQYRERSEVFNRARLRATAAEGAYAADRSAANARRLERARTALQTAALEASTAQTAYRNARISNNPQPRVQVLRRAATATSDRSAKLQILLFAGFVAGLLIGLALASLTANRALRRRLAV